MNRIEDRMDPVAEAQFIAGAIPGARLVELPGAEHPPFLGDTDRVLDELHRFITSIRTEEAALERVLATVMFTDIVGSTDRAAALGDRAWGDVLERHHELVRAMLARYRGTEVDTAGDGFFATFDGPARATKCAIAIVEGVKPLGIEVRAGVHTGEVQTLAGKTGGMAVVIGSRVGAKAQASEVLASQTVKDLTAGSGLIFEDAGEHELKGVPDRWHLYRVVE
jgi:class 3 adenylate cyclase